jgi:hypothetical protein
MRNSLSRLFAPCRAAAAVLLLALALPAAPAAAQVTVSVSGNTATAQVSLAGGYGADFTLAFQNAQNLSASSLGISASVVNPLDATLLARLPTGAGLSIPAAFPVMISVSPPALGGLSFTNGVAVEIHTHNLTFTQNSPFRIYKAPAGGKFYDITGDVLAGSVRTRGTTGGFSDFLIVVDTGSLDDNAEDKYDYLDARTDTNSVSSTARAALLADLASSKSAYDQGNYALAKTRLDTFRSDLLGYAGNGVPNVWRAARDLDNVAGDLLAESAALQFTLGRLASQ